jgi:dTDP-4-amino-4,6-dideoxygalactose transaminase
MDKIGELIKTTEFIGGKEVELFEKEYGEWTHTKYVVGASNGTDAIIIALKALGVGPGDKVLVPDNTFIATAEAVTAVGAEVDFIDIESDYYAMDPIQVEEYMKPTKGRNVKAIIPVHLYGQMANMPVLREIADKYGIKVIEDSAQAHGSKLLGNQPGYWGDIATYSFYPGKNLGAFGDAGAIATNNPDLYKKCRMLVNHGRWHEKYTHEIEGYNMRLDTIQAAILRIKLQYIDEWTRERKKKVAKYLQLLANTDSVVSPKTREGAEPVWHIFPVLCKNRDAVIEKFKKAGILYGIHYPVPLHLQPAYSYKGYKTNDYPITEKVANSELSLPLWPEIDEQTIGYITKIL